MAWWPCSGSPGPSWERRAWTIIFRAVQRNLRVPHKVVWIHFQSELTPGERSDLVILKQFVPIGPDEVDRVLSAVSAATCQLDLCPSWVMKACRTVTARWIKGQVNSSLQERTFQRSPGLPLFKKLFLDPTCLDNFCPIFHLPFLSK